MKIASNFLRAFPLCALIFSASCVHSTRHVESTQTTYRYVDDALTTASITTVLIDESAPYTLGEVDLSLTCAANDEITSSTTHAAVTKETIGTMWSAAMGVVMGYLAGNLGVFGGE